MMKTSIESLHADQEVMEELRDLMHSSTEVPRAEKAPGGTRAVISALESFGGTPASIYDSDQSITEAIILSMGRPSLLVRNGQFDPPETVTWQERLAPHQTRVNQQIPAIGRVELLNHQDYDWIGTAWMVADDVLVTNRHVAEVFSERRNDGFSFVRNLSGQSIGVRVDFREEYERTEEFEIVVNQILYVSPAGSMHPDIAFLRVERHNDLPAPIPLAEEKMQERDLVGVIGYPARDSRNAGPDMSRIFADIFDVKRFAPGYVLQQISPSVFTHDCTTLGGNSGSVVINLATGKAVGLHFAGRFKEANYAVSIGTVKQALAQMSTFQIAVGGVPEAERREPEDYAGRRGYSEDFLGSSAAVHVPLPELTPGVRSDTVSVNSQLRGMSRYTLDYTHFSVVMSRSRRLARYTAVNIDGSQEVVIRRRNTTWLTDPRIDDAFQIDNALYHHNRLDRGHLVRRLDPVWGTDEEAKLAEEDTFHYTNATPQHEKLNQRSWLHLEDYLLDNANMRDFKLTIFTGPIFQEADPVYRDVQIPQSFWKVAVMVNEANQLHATAYKLGQSQFLDDLEFAFGAFETYQVPVRAIEAEAGITFGNLSDFDPLGQIEGRVQQRIQGPEDIIF